MAKNSFIISTAAKQQEKEEQLAFGFAQKCANGIFRFGVNFHIFAEIMAAYFGAFKCEKSKEESKEAFFVRCMAAGQADFMALSDNMKRALPLYNIMANEEEMISFLQGNCIAYKEAGSFLFARKMQFAFLSSNLSEEELAALEEISADFSEKEALEAELAAGLISAEEMPKYYIFGAGCFAARREHAAALADTKALEIMPAEASIFCKADFAEELEAWLTGSEQKRLQRKEELAAMAESAKIWQQAAGSKAGNFYMLQASERFNYRNVFTLFYNLCSEQRASELAAMKKKQAEEKKQKQQAAKQLASAEKLAGFSEKAEELSEAMLAELKPCKQESKLAGIIKRFESEQKRLQSSSSKHFEKLSELSSAGFRASEVAEAMASAAEEKQAASEQASERAEELAAEKASLQASCWLAGWQKYGRELQKKQAAMLEEAAAMLKKSEELLASLQACRSEQSREKKQKQAKKLAEQASELKKQAASLISEALQQREEKKQQLSAMKEELKSSQLSAGMLEAEAMAAKREAALAGQAAEQAEKLSSVYMANKQAWQQASAKLQSLLQLAKASKPAELKEKLAAWLEEQKKLQAELQKKQAEEQASEEQPASSEKPAESASEAEEKPAEEQASEEQASSEKPASENAE